MRKSPWLGLLLATVVPARLPVRTGPGVEEWLVALKQQLRSQARGGPTAHGSRVVIRRQFIPPTNPESIFSQPSCYLQTERG